MFVKKLYLIKNCDYRLELNEFRSTFCHNHCKPQKMPVAICYCGRRTFDYCNCWLSFPSVMYTSGLFFLDLPWQLASHQYLNRVACKSAGKLSEPRRTRLLLLCPSRLDSTVLIDDVRVVEDGQTFFASSVLAGGVDGLCLA